MTTRDYVEAVTGVLAAPKASVRRSKAKDVATGVTGTALAQLTNQAAELAESGRRVVGKPIIVRSVITGRTTNPATMTVSVCLDTSRVKLLDRSGRTVSGGSAPARTRNILTLVQRDGRWLVSGQTFPDNPNC